MESKLPLLGMSLDELKEVVASLSMPAFSAKQICGWIYGKKVRSIDEMTNISLKFRNLLSEKYEIGCSLPVETMRSCDGTVKYLYKTLDGNYVETVYIPDGDRATLCVSSQVGCKMGCLFCETGKQGFSGNLRTADIMNQIYSIEKPETLTNIVFMGQGEPFDNLDNVMKALDILTADYGYAWSPKRITVSTVGFKKNLKRFIEESECHLAISLHNPFHEQRLALMPAEKQFAIADIVSLLKNYDFSHQRRLSFEYIVFDGVNDSKEHADALLKLLRGLECRVNLIRFHKIPEVGLNGVSDERMVEFRDYLTGHGLFTTVRASRGQDIYAACGLLTTAKLQGKCEHKN